MKKHKQTLNCLILLKRLYKNDARLANNVQNSLKNIRRFLNGKKKIGKWEGVAIRSTFRIHQKDFFAKNAKITDLQLF